jgi:hypothetical protein
VHGYVLVGSGIAVLIIILCFAPPKYWLKPSKCRIPADFRELGPAFLILVGVNAITAAVRLGRLLILNRVDVRSGSTGAYTYSSLGEDDFIYFLGGAICAFIIGVITTQDGVTKLVAESKSPTPARRRRQVSSPD